MRNWRGDGCDYPPLLHFEAFGVRWPEVERKKKVSVAGIARFSEQLGHASAAAAAPSHGIALELNAGPFRHSVENADLIEDSFYERTAS